MRSREQLDAISPVPSGRLGHRQTCRQRRRPSGVHLNHCIGGALASSADPHFIPPRFCRCTFICRGALRLGRPVPAGRNVSRRISQSQLGLDNK
jgi:hypothetical protein